MKTSTILNKLCAITLLALLLQNTYASDCEVWAVPSGGINVRPSTSSNIGMIPYSNMWSVIRKRTGRPIEVIAANVGLWGPAAQKAQSVATSSCPLHDDREFLCKVKIQPNDKVIVQVGGLGENNQEKFIDALIVTNEWKETSLKRNMDMLAKKKLPCIWERPATQECRLSRVFSEAMGEPRYNIMMNNETYSGISGLSYEDGMTQYHQMSSTTSSTERPTGPTMPHCHFGPLLAPIDCSLGYQEDLGVIQYGDLGNSRPMEYSEAFAILQERISSGECAGIRAVGAEAALPASINSGPRDLSRPSPVGGHLEGTQVPAPAHEH